ncbi:unnamed protein product [Linum trigynum]|uniref:Uncharacterized protein n=1 Tax=Linum trigynum TaxID=586398 RepID=A0AAV2DCK2_9ROSI
MLSSYSWLGRHKKKKGNDGASSSRGPRHPSTPRVDLGPVAPRLSSRLNRSKPTIVIEEEDSLRDLSSHFHFSRRSLSHTSRRLSIDSKRSRSMNGQLPPEFEVMETDNSWRFERTQLKLSCIPSSSFSVGVLVHEDNKMG